MIALQTYDENGFYGSVTTKGYCAHIETNYWTLDWAGSADTQGDAQQMDAITCDTGYSFSDQQVFLK